MVIRAKTLEQLSMKYFIISKSEEKLVFTYFQSILLVKEWIQ